MNICSFCNKEIKTDDKDVLVYNNNLVHKSCYEKNKNKRKIGKKGNPVLKKNIRKCLYCGKDIDIGNDEYLMPRQHRYAHKECYEKNYNPDDKYIQDIYKYLKEIGLSYDYAQCEKQRVNFITKLGYTNKGIYYSLRYFYSIKKQSITKSQNRIGIVPYIYEEATNYYINIELKKQKIQKQLEKEKQKKHIIIKLKEQENVQDKGYINIDNL